MKLHEIAEMQTLENFLGTYCKSFLRELGEDAATLADSEQSLKLSMYRGVDRKNSDVVELMVDGDPHHGYIKTVRKDRLPRDTDPQVSRIVDDLLEEQFGWKPRSKGVFCFGWAKRGHANDYGVPCKIYPMGNVEVVYSPSVFDLTPMIYRAIRDKDITMGYGEEFSPEKLEKIKEVVTEFIKAQKYSDDLKDAIYSGKSEIMVNCERYLAVPLK